MLVSFSPSFPKRHEVIASDTHTHHEVLPHHRPQSNKVWCPYSGTTNTENKSKDFSMISWFSCAFIAIHQECWSVLCLYTFKVLRGWSKWPTVTKKMCFILVLKQTSYKILNEITVAGLNLLASYAGPFSSPLVSKAYQPLRAQDGLLSLYSVQEWVHEVLFSWQQFPG